MLKHFLDDAVGGVWLIIVRLILVHFPRGVLEGIDDFNRFG